MAVLPSTDKFIYVTGCDTGFGSILTKKLDKLGFSVIAGVYLVESIAKIESECSENVYPIQVDVSQESSVENGAKKIRSILQDKGGVLHGIVNNAGILVSPGQTEWTSNEVYRKIFNVNVMGTVMTTKSLLPLIRKSQGRIINVASIAGRIGLPTQPAYSMSKYAVEGYSEVLRKDMYGWGVTVHIIEPGVFKSTGLYNSFFSGFDQLWENLSPEIKQDYGEEFRAKAKEAMKKGLEVGSTKSHLVPEAMIEALTSAQPKYRYKVGIDSKYIVSWLEKCHESVQDGILTGRWLKEPNVPASAPRNGGQIAANRYHKAWPRFIIFCLVLLFVLRKLRN